MNKEIDVLSSAVTSKQTESAEPTRDATRDCAAAWRDGEVEQDLTVALHQSESTTQGTLASNTVPPNDKNKHFKALLFGIDSLYLSYYGQLAEDWDKRLFELKESAQSEDEKNQALAQVAIGSHLFEVRDKGMRVFLMFYQITASSSN